jgi:putative transposase
VLQVRLARPTASVGARRGDKWHLYEVVITIAGKKHWLWRAVEQEGFVLDARVRSWRDKKTGKRLLPPRLRRLSTRHKAMK